MADNTIIQQASTPGDTISTEDIGGGIKLPRSKIVIGDHDTDGGDVASDNPLPVNILNTPTVNINNTSYDNVSGTPTQLVKIMYGSPGNDQGLVSTENPMPVSITNAMETYEGGSFLRVKMGVGDSGNDDGDVSIDSPIPTNQVSVTVNTANCNASVSAGNTATVSYSAYSSNTHIIGGVAWSYSGSGTFSNGGLSITNGGAPVFNVDITNLGPGFIPFTPPIDSGVSNGLTISLNGAGSSIVGKINVLSHWTILPLVTTDSLSMGEEDDATIDGTVEIAGLAPVFSYGVVYGTSSSPTLSNSVFSAGTGLGSFSAHITGLSFGQTYYFRAYAQNAYGVSYGSNQSGTAEVPCLIEGTLITLADGSTKCIEDVCYEDELLVWNFDEGRFDIAKPVWISRPSTMRQHNLIKFSNDSELRTVLPHRGHRIFNIDKGLFTYSMTEDTPIGTRAFNENGRIVSVIRKTLVTEKARFYNILTNHHMNVFANAILTSSGLNNIYPIVDMKFVKDNREVRSRDEFREIPESIFTGLRLAEQPRSFTGLKKNLAIKMRVRRPLSA